MSGIILSYLTQERFYFCASFLVKPFIKQIPVNLSQIKIFLESGTSKLFIARVNLLRPRSVLLSTANQSRCILCSGVAQEHETSRFPALPGLHWCSARLIEWTQKRVWRSPGDLRGHPSMNRRCRGHTSKGFRLHLVSKRGTKSGRATKQGQSWTERGRHTCSFLQYSPQLSSVQIGYKMKTAGRTAQEAVIKAALKLLLRSKVGTKTWNVVAWRAQWVFLRKVTRNYFWFKTFFIATLVRKKIVFIK